MKQIITLIIFTIPLAAFGQIEKGRFLATGNLSFQKNDFGDQLQSYGTAPEVKQIEISPSIGYLVSSKFAVGLIGGYAKTDQKYPPVNSFSLSGSILESYSIGPFIRYYHPIGEKFYFFGQADFKYYKSEMTQIIDFTERTYRSFETNSFSIRPGISYFIAKRLAVEVILGSISYNKTSFSHNGGDTNGFAFNFITRGLSPGVTFTF